MDDKPLLAQMQLEQPSHLWLVFDDQDGCFLLALIHGAFDAEASRAVIRGPQLLPFRRLWQKNPETDPLYLLTIQPNPPPMIIYDLGCDR